MNDEILSEEEVARRRSMHVCARTRPTGCEYCEALDCITTLRADRDRWRVTAESDAADLAMAYALGELAAADRDRLEARLAEVRRERDDLEVSLATVAAGFEQARARVARLEAALRKYGHHGPMCDGLPRGWGGAPLGPCDCGLDAALAPASDQLPVPEQTTAEPEHPDPERWPGTTERPWFVEGLTAMDRFRSRVIFFVGDSDQDRADLAMIVEAVNAHCPSAWTPEVGP